MITSTPLHSNNLIFRTEERPLTPNKLTTSKTFITALDPALLSALVHAALASGCQAAGWVWQGCCWGLGEFCGRGYCWGLRGCCGGGRGGWGWFWGLLFFDLAPLSLCLFIPRLLFELVPLPLCLFSSELLNLCLRELFLLLLNFFLPFLFNIRFL